MATAKDKAKYHRDAALKRLTVTQDLSSRIRTDPVALALFRARFGQIETHYHAFRVAHDDSFNQSFNGRRIHYR